ncbi:GDSL-like lipase/acylhydrolase family protein [Winogradskyella wandonensis]|uniref:GDSL-like lipase/acylhydrolase family protein n=1 Tax=Winogradskyella wandonensis TaxID=1442586 RepID=A0A4R1KSR5_9FLAO|nr:G-D-S-L family lipolytic protein [Winogradskyella wandonensis]TCK67647.1 GDSL-like lipase/acylhydrolase family protein [Winogradskyella wandonensis]
MKNLKYIALSIFTLGFLACENETLEDLRNRGQEEPVVFEDFTQGSADFSKFVSMGNSLTAGFADGALYKISQENSTPAIMAEQFAALANGGSFTQPLMNDNVGGLLAGGNPLPGFGPRLVFNGSGPAPLQSLVPSASPTTDIVLNNPTGPFNNLGVPGAKSFHLLAPGYGNFSGVIANPPTANPYFVRMASSPGTSVIADAVAQQPSFISLWIGNNDVLGYALSGGDGSNPITPMTGPPGVGFEQTYQALAATLTGNVPGVQGILGNIPNVTAIPHFTTVPHDPVPLDAATAGAVNQAYAQYNGGLQLALANSLITSEEAAARTINFEASATNAVVIVDEDLTDLSGLGLPNFRQATAADLLVLPAASFIGTLADPNNPLSVNGVAIPLSDRWVLTPEEQAEIADATAQYNGVISAVASANGFALLDANALLDELASSGIATSGLVLTSDLVTGGAFSLDGVHPTSRGYALIANEMLKAIDATYGTNFEASGNLVDVSTYNTNYSPGLLQ